MAPHPRTATPYRPIRRAATVCTALMLLLPPVEAPGWPEPPETRFRRAAMRVVELLETKHLDAAPLDDARSRLLFERYFQVLDPSRLHFLEQDIEELASARDTLDDRLRAGDFGFPLAVFARFAERVGERLADVRDLVASPMDLEDLEYVEADRTQAPRARSAAEARELWRKQIKLEALERITAGTPLDAALGDVLARHEEIARNVRATTTAELVETYLTALATTYDPHSAYLAPQSVAEFDAALRLDLEGIGAVLGSEGGEIVVREIVPGGAAERDGRLAPGDRILAVGEGEDGEAAGVTGTRLADVVRRIRGKRGTVVRLDVLHAGGAAETVLIRRARIDVPGQAARGEVVRHEGPGGGAPLLAGVITLPSFYGDPAASGKEDGPGARSSARDVRAILETFRREPVDVVVVDLRRNAGGALAEAVDLTGLFIDTGPVVRIQGPGGELRTESDTDAGVAWAGPLIVLTSRFTASAAEIFAGAIQDHRRGLVAGDRSTFGKGTVQMLVPLAAPGEGEEPDALGALKLTVSQFYRPLGESTHGIGVIPDIEIPSLSSHEGGEDQLGGSYPVRVDRIPPVPVEDHGLASPEVVAGLRRRSAARSAAREDLRRVKEEIARRLEARSRRWIALDEKVLEAKRASPAGAPAQEKGPALRATPGHPPAADAAIEVDAYLREVLGIASDYATLLAGER